jgi:hypothetical protein
MPTDKRYFLAAAGSPAHGKVDAVMAHYQAVADSWAAAFKRVAAHYHWPIETRDAFLFRFADGTIKSPRKKVKNVEITSPQAGAVAFMEQSTVPLWCRDGELRIKGRLPKDFAEVVGPIEDMPRPGWELWEALLQNCTDAEKIEDGELFGEDFTCAPGIRKVGGDYLLTLRDNWTQWAALCVSNGIVELRGSGALRRSVGRGVPRLFFSERNASHMNQAPVFEYRHGDVGLIRVAELPAGAIQQERRGDLILQQGTSTGHAHRIKAKTAQTFTAGVARYLAVKRPTTLTHEEHGPIAVEPGVYEVRIEADYVPGEPPRQVWD